MSATSPAADRQRRALDALERAALDAAGAAARAYIAAQALRPAGAADAAADAVHRLAAGAIDCVALAEALRDPEAAALAQSDRRAFQRHMAAVRARLAADLEGSGPAAAAALGGAG